MLQIKNLTITHRKDLRTMLEDFQLVLNDGDKAVIIGEEGDGKSTLLKWICDPALTEPYAECRGERLLGRERPGYLPQELPPEDTEKSVYEFFAESEGFAGASPKERGRMAVEAGLEADVYFSGQRMGSLSGGEKVKIQLLRLLLDDPTVLLLDEPSNDLDLATLSMLETLIANWKHAVLFVSHDETLIRHTANMVVHLEQVARKSRCRYTVQHQSYDQYLQDRANRFERQDRKAQSDRREKKKRDETYRRVFEGVARAQSAISRQDPHGGALLKKKMHAVKSMERRFEREDESMTKRPEQEEAIGLKLSCEPVPHGKTVLDYRLDRLLSDDGGRVLAEGIRFFVRGPEKVCIVGANGAGKTTLLRKIAEEMLARTDIQAAYMPQNYEDLLEPDMTPVDFLDETGEKEVRTRIRTYLGALNFTADEMEHPSGALSGGQKVKLLLLKLSLSHADVLILDEPTRNLSPLSGPVLRRQLAAFPGAIISVSHDRLFMTEVCTRVLRLTEQGLTELDPLFKAGSADSESS